MSDALLSHLSQRLQTLFAQEGEAAAGFALARHILRHYPHHLVTYVQLGHAALAAGLYADANDIFPRALSADPEDGGLWAGQAQTAAALGRQEEAAAARSMAADHTPTATGGLVGQAATAATRGDWPEALRLYRHAHSVYPHRIDAVLGLAMAFGQLDRLDAAHTLATQVINQLPYCLKARWILVRIAAQQGPTQAAREHLRIARSLDPDDFYAWRWFGTPGESAPPPQAALPAWNEQERWASNNQQPTINN